VYTVCLAQSSNARGMLSESHGENEAEDEKHIVPGSKACLMEKAW
jgi:hypothetical protein